MEKYQYFDGLKFTRDEKTGYYLNSTIRKRLHRYVWEYYNGEIPEGYHIHHINKDKSNNDISNLQLIKGEDHVTFHGLERGETQYDAIIENLNKNARPKANEWHGSEEGHLWHKKQYNKHLKKWIDKRVKQICEQCGNEFETIDNKKARFCSNKCKSKWRRESGIDDVKRECNYCGSEFTVNKYYKTKYCSKSCMKKDYWEGRSV